MMNEDGASNEKENKEKKEDENFFKNLCSKITLEPMWLGIICSVMMTQAIFKNLSLERACLVDLGYSEDVCLKSEGEEKTRIELESQKIVSTLMVGSSFIGGFITIAIVLILGPWSDVSGRRKPLIILPIVGKLVESIMILLTLYYPKLSTIWVIYANVLPMAIGDIAFFTMASFNYLGDICFKTGRCITVVIAINSGCCLISSVVGTIIGPILYTHLGYKGLFAVGLVLEMKIVAEDGVAALLPEKSLRAPEGVWAQMGSADEESNNEDDEPKGSDDDIQILKVIEPNKVTASIDINSSSSEEEDVVMLEQDQKPIKNKAKGKINKKKLYPF